VTDSDLPSEQDLPLVLWTDFDVSRTRSRGLATIDMIDHLREDLVGLAAGGAQVSVCGETFTPRSAFRVQDRFTIRGTTRL
jgi:hypothetical protein